VASSIVVAVALVLVLVPLYWMVVTAFRPFMETSGAYPPTLLPKTFTLENFHIALVEKEGAKALLDSVIISLGSLALCIAVGIPGAYSLSRYHLLGGRLPFTVLSFRFMPAIVVSVALYQVATTTGFQDTHLALILVNTLIGLPFLIWVMKGFFDEIPVEIEEAAAIDGASRHRMLWHIVVPLATPGLVTTSLFVFVFAWNELLFAVILTDVSVRPFPKLIPGMTAGVSEPHWGAIAAMSVIVTVPVLLAAFYLQRYIVRGLTYGAVR
jgi:multiple sugar transport system permease protein